MRVVVIGSGIVGASAAYYLSGRGVAVTVVDRGSQGQATQAGAGIVCPWVDHPEDDAWYRLTSEGARHYPRLVEALGEDIGYAKVGALLVAEDPVDLEPVRALLRRRYADAPEMGEVTDVLTPSDLFPPLSDDLSALLVPGAARVDGSAVRDALLRAAVARGAEVLHGSAVLTADGQVRLHAADEDIPAGNGPRRAQPGPGAGAVSGRTTSWRQAAPLAPDYPPSATGDLTESPLEASAEGPVGAAGDAPFGGPPDGSPGGPAPASEPVPPVVEPIVPVPPAEPVAPSAAGRVPAGEGVPQEADVVIVAAGAWTGEVCRPLGVELPVFPRRGQILHATLDGVDTAFWPIVLPRSGPYLLGFPGSRVVIGATVEDVGFAPRVTMGGLEEVIAAGLRVAPGLFGATVSETRVGLRPVNAPGPALIGRLTPRVVVATGLSAYGLTAGPFTGELVAKLALDEHPPIDLTPYAPRTA
ncbi:NAD(P)/FAD-dependent oxidoreductase [Nonomuraea sp. NPDC049655]|uniref:NAD(P)/FAD-dependent oxidoreductase n=1 Tax=Nonomuraea sp. NPDC049655 TaxID=3364355 RepID=UPI003795413D